MATYKRSTNPEFNLFLQKIRTANIAHAEAQSVEYGYAFCRACRVRHSRSQESCLWRTNFWRALYNFIFGGRI